MKKSWWLGVVLLFVIGISALGGNEDPDAPPMVQAAAPEGLAVQYTNLICRELACYDGAYLEDGTDEEMAGITALVLENTGNTGLRQTSIVVIKDGQSLNFEASFIPPNSTVLVLEKNRFPYAGPEMDSCYCLTAIPEEFDCADDQIAIKEEGMGLTVTNLTAEEMTGIRLHYKQYYAQEALYLGGITYSTEIYCLLPGESRSISPYHYAAGYGAVVAVEISNG